MHLSTARRPIPVPLTQLHGRDAEVARLVSLVVEQGARLVTITGTGGCGKTRVAIEVALRASPGFEDEAAFVTLAEVGDPRLVTAEIARSLGIATPAAADDVDALCETLRARRILAVIDNFEHLADATDVIAELVARCPQLSLLVTSRRRLGVPGEQVVPLAPLDVASGPAPALFWERARAVQPGLDVTPERERAVAEICTRLDGLPLAIELAAARSRLLSPEALLDRLTTSTWQVLRHSATDASRRTDSLDQAIGWSHDLLDEAARTLFRRLSVFEGAFTLEMAEAIVADADLAVDDVFDALSTLVDLHLVEPDADGTRYSMLRTIRLFAGDRLAEAGEGDQLGHRHTEAFLAVASALAAELESERERVAYQRIDVELPELRAAMARLEQTGRGIDALRIAVAIGPYWLFRGRFTEGCRWLATDRQSDGTVDGLVVARATGWSARLTVDASGGPAADGGEEIAALERTWSLLDPAENRRAWLWASEHLSYALRLYEGAERAAHVTEAALIEANGAGLDWWVAEMLHRRSLIAAQAGDREHAIELAHRAIDAATAGGHERIAIRALQALTLSGGFGGDLVAAERALEEARGRSEAFGDLRGLASTLAALGAAASTAGDRSRAAHWFRRAIEFGDETGYWHGAALGLVGIAAMAAEGPEPAAGAHLHGALSPHLPMLERELGPQIVGEYRDAMVAAQRSLGAGSYATAVAEGRAGTWAAALQEAGRVAASWEQPAIRHERLVRPTPSRKVGGRQPLSARELEVLELVAAGHTNHEIAEQLHMSPKTAMHHTGHIYRKLGVRGRAQAVAYATAHGLNRRW